MTRIGAMTMATLLVATTLSAAEPRNQWYRDSRVWVHFDNHSSLLGKGQSVDDLTAMLGTIPADMLQVSAQSNTYATYPTELGWNHPQADGYDTVGTFKEVASRLGRKLCLYLSVDRRPIQLKEHPEWGALDAQGKPIINGEPIVCQRPNRRHQGYLYEQFLPQLRELVTKYDPDGFWFDGDYALRKPCWCANCLAEWQAETGTEAPRSDASPDWPRWLAWHQQRYQAYREAVGEAIHAASPKALYTSNWSWAWTPEPVPDCVDTLSGDAWSIRQVFCVTQRWGAQQQTPWDVMSFCMPASRTSRDYSLQRTLQEGAVTIASGGIWCLWAFGGDQVPPAGVEIARHAAEFAQDRTDALGSSVSLAHVAVLDSETSWAAGAPADINSPAHDLARALAETHYFTDLINETTFRQHLTPYRVVFLPGCRQLAPETLVALRAWTEDGGLLLAVGAALYGPDAEDAGAAWLGLSREPRSGRQALVLGRGRASLGDLWTVRPGTARVVATFADGTPALASQPCGKGTVAYLASGDWRYPDDALGAALLAKLGYGPSYQIVDAPADAALFCTLRRRGEDTVLHCVDLTTRVGGVVQDVDAPDRTDWNPSRRATIVLACDRAPELLSTRPRGVRTGLRVENSQVRLSLADWQTHAAAVLRLPPGASVGLLPADTPLPPDAFHPENRRGGVLFVDDFSALPTGERPASPWRAEVRAGVAIAAVDEPGTGRHCLKFTDTVDSSFWPFLHRSVSRFRQGTARLDYDLRVGSGADCLMELRYEGKGAGPSVRLEGTGRLSHGGKELATLSPDVWYHFAVTVRLGDEQPSFDLTVTPPTGEPLVFPALPYATDWFFLCDSVYFVGAGNQPGEFYLDNVRLERLAAE